VHEEIITTAAAGLAVYIRRCFDYRCHLGDFSFGNPFTAAAEAAEWQHNRLLDTSDCQKVAGAD
jgi:hypothetical protein